MHVGRRAQVGEGRCAQVRDYVWLGRAGTRGSGSGRGRVRAGAGGREKPWGWTSGSSHGEAWEQERGGAQDRSAWIVRS
jgi:hypothetical protein